LRQTIAILRHAAVDAAVGGWKVFKPIAKRLNFRVTPKNGGARLLRLIEAGDAGLNVSDNLLKFGLVAGFQTWFQPFEQRFNDAFEICVEMILGEVGAGFEFLQRRIARSWRNRPCPRRGRRQCWPCLGYAFAILVAGRIGEVFHNLRGQQRFNHLPHVGLE